VVVPSSIPSSSVIWDEPRSRCKKARASGGSQLAWMRLIDS
jgi:hypothetical protein